MLSWLKEFLKQRLPPVRPGGFRGADIVEIGHEEQHHREKITGNARDRSECRLRSTAHKWLGQSRHACRSPDRVLGVPKGASLQETGRRDDLYGFA